MLGTPCLHHQWTTTFLTQQSPLLRFKPFTSDATPSELIFLGGFWFWDFLFLGGGSASLPHPQPINLILEIFHFINISFHENSILWKIHFMQISFCDNIILLKFQIRIIIPYKSFIFILRRFHFLHFMKNSFYEKFVFWKFIVDKLVKEERWISGPLPENPPKNSSQKAMLGWFFCF